MSLHPALSTTFTAPADCTNNYYMAGLEWTSPPVVEATISQKSSCFASYWTSPANNYAKGQNTWVGSPICPQGQTVAQTYTDVSQSTTAICCSSQWGNVYANGNALEDTTYSFHMCVTSWTSATTKVAGPTSLTGGSTVLSGPGTLESTAEYVFLYNKDMITTSSSSTTVSSTSSASFTSTSTSPTAITSSSDTTSSGLSQGASIGIGVGIALGAVLIAILGFLIYRYRRNARELKKNTAWVDQAGDRPDHEQYFKPELSGEARPLYEMSDEQRRLEVEGNQELNIPRELE